MCRPVSICRFVSRLRHSPQGALGALLVALILTAIAVGPVLAPHNPETFHPQYRLQGPIPGFWLGTDQFGRDLLSRILAGARPTVLFGVTATLMGTVLGTVVGVLSGYPAGWLDDLIMRVMDGMLAIPGLLFALLIITALGTGKLSALVAIGVAFTPGMARVARSATLAVRTQDYVKAAVARGERPTYLVLREILPNVVAAVVVEASIRIAFAIMLGASLSFLGVGAQPPSSDWGLMVSEGRAYMFSNPWVVVWPGLSIAVVSIAFNLFGDGLRDMLNPRVAG
jgi:peptide/nickel transport system permease protein